MSFQYDAVYNRTRLTYPDSQYMVYVYDALNRVTQVREYGLTTNPEVLATYSYDPLSRRTNLARGNATSTAFGFDLASRLTSMTHDLGGTTHDAVFSYNWTVASQLARRQSTNGQLSGWPVAARSDTYAVNGLNQYTTVTGRTIEDLDTRTARGIDPGQLGQLIDLGWVPEHPNLLITGPTGVGKSFIAAAFAHAACRADFSVRCFRLPRLVEELARYAAMQMRSAYYRQLAKVDLIVRDP